jgi:hypothetical protein
MVSILGPCAVFLWLWQFGYDFQSIVLELVPVSGIARDFNAQIKLRLHYKDQSIDRV